MPVAFWRLDDNKRLDNTKLYFNSASKL